MSNNVAIVTGANKGLGLAIVKGLCEKFNGVVFLTSRDERRGNEACVELNKLGLNSTFHQLDVTDDGSVTSFCNFIKEKNDKVDILINNAGILFLKDATESKIYQAEQTILVNFTSLVKFTEAMIPLMKTNARIVNISSSSGHLSRIPSEELRREFKSSNITLEDLNKLIDRYLESVRQNREIDEGWGNSPYVVSKVAVNAYTFMLHRKLYKSGITVNCVHPGYVMSDMTRGAGNVSPAEAAAGALRLALEPTEGGLYVWHNGATVPWDGLDPRGYIDGKQL